MAKVPFPCCCSPGNCGDYGLEWEYNINDVVVADQDSYANAGIAGVSPSIGYGGALWYYWDAATAIAVLNAWAQSVTFDLVADSDGPGTIELSGQSFDIGYRKLLSTTLNLSVELYAVEGVIKPAQISFIPYTFTWDDIDAIVSIREGVGGTPSRRLTQLSLYGTLTHDPLPGTATVTQFTLPNLGFSSNVAGKFLLAHFRTIPATKSCARPIRADLELLRSVSPYYSTDIMFFEDWLVTADTFPNRLVSMEMPWTTSTDPFAVSRADFDLA